MVADLTTIGDVESIGEEEKSGMLCDGKVNLRETSLGFFVALRQIMHLEAYSTFFSLFPSCPNREANMQASKVQVLIPYVVRYRGIKHEIDMSHSFPDFKIERDPYQIDGR